MTDTRDTDAKDGLGSQLWGALKNALTDEDPLAQARRAKLQGGKTLVAATPASTKNESAAEPTVHAPMSPMAAALLEQVLSKATAYTALTEKLTPLEPIIADERTRYQAAYALIKASRSVEQVVQSIDMQHMQLLEAEAGRFATQLREKERAELGTRSAESQTLSAGIDAATQQMARLREELDARIQQIEATAARDRERLAQVTQEIAAKRQELARVQQQFDAAAGTVREALARAKATVLRHLA
jgi:chromosome segregation ATPase